MLEKYFSKIPGGPKPEEMATVEPKQFAEKTVTIREQTQAHLHLRATIVPITVTRTTRFTTPSATSWSNGRVSRLYRSLVRDQKDCRGGGGVSVDFPAQNTQAFSFSAPSPCRDTRQPRARRNSQGN